MVLTCISGFLYQTVLPREIILVGRKNLLHKLKGMIKRDNITKVSYIQFNGEKNEARNKGIIKSQGSHVIYVDVDMVPASKLIEKCEMMLSIYNALFIPEKGFEGKGIKERIFELEKKIIQGDEDAQTPRLFKKNLFKKGELPFQSKFGMLDEWGFFLNLKRKRPKIGVVNSYFTVKDTSNLRERFYKSYKKGVWAKNFIKENNKEGFRRINPLRRGLVVYTKKIKYFKQQPFIFSCLVLVKCIDFISFILGFYLHVFQVITLKENYVKRSN